RETADATLAGSSVYRKYPSLTAQLPESLNCPPAATAHRTLLAVAPVAVNNPIDSILLLPRLGPHSDQAAFFAPDRVDCPCSGRPATDRQFPADNSRNESTVRVYPHTQ